MAKHYGFVKHDAKNQEINDPKFCMFKYLNPNHKCCPCFLKRKKKTQEKDNINSSDNNDNNENKENKENKDELIRDMPLLPVGVVAVYGFSKMFDTPKDAKMAYTRNFDASCCDCGLLVCGEIKDLVQFYGAVTIRSNTFRKQGKRKE